MGRRHFGLRPSFPSSSSLQTLGDLVDQITSGDEAGEGLESRLLREVVIAAKDRPQLLSRITKAMVRYLFRPISMRFVVRSGTRCPRSAFVYN